MGKRGRYNPNWAQSEPWHFSHVMQLPIANTFTQIQTSQSEDAPYEFEYIDMYDPSALQATQSQLMPFILGVHYAITPYSSGILFGSGIDGSIAGATQGSYTLVNQSLSVMAALFDDGGEAQLLEVDQIGIADLYAEFRHQYTTSGALSNTCAAIALRRDCEVTLQKGWLPSPCLTLAFLPTMGSAVDATTFPAGLISVQGFLEVEWREVSPEKLRQQALARVFEKGG